MSAGTCKHAASGCDYPASECGGSCTSAMRLGPWEACGNLIRTKREADGTGGFLVAEVPANTGDTNAKALAMAAAPELIAALREATSMLQSACLVITDREARQMAMEVVRSGRAVLARATGAQS